VEELLSMSKLREPLQIITNAANANNLGLLLEKLGTKFMESPQFLVTVIVPDHSP